MKRKSTRVFDIGANALRLLLKETVTLLIRKSMLICAQASYERSQ